jgi:carbamoyl-phosphate synthase large subunit
MDEARSVVEDIGLPCDHPPGLHARRLRRRHRLQPRGVRGDRKRGLDLSMISEILVEESVLGWKEYELEVMRDKADNVVIICSIENLDPMGVHTGDSITVAPAQTLTDREYQRMRDASLAIIREIGVETGGCNIQFAVDPEDGRAWSSIEMNPRVSRSSALASQGHRLPDRQDRREARGRLHARRDPNDITARRRPASSRRSTTCVTKIPRWAFEKFPGADATP